jgi:hypothetical protein
LSQIASVAESVGAEPTHLPELEPDAIEQMRDVHSSSLEHVPVSLRATQVEASAPASPFAPGADAAQYAVVLHGMLAEHAPPGSLPAMQCEPSQ